MGQWAVKVSGGTRGRFSKCTGNGSQEELTAEPYFRRRRCISGKLDVIVRESFQGSIKADPDEGGTEDFQSGLAGESGDGFQFLSLLKHIIGTPCPSVLPSVHLFS